MDLSHDRMIALGLRPGSLVTADGAMRYTAGVIQRERERLAEIFIKNGLHKIASAILDASADDLVFKWMGPEAPLAVKPVPFTAPAPPRPAGPVGATGGAG